MKLFLGEYQHNLDDRSRVTLAKKIRQELTENQVILTKGFESCISGYDLRSWETESSKQLESPVTVNDSRELRRFLFSAALKVEIDKLGRVLLPTHLKEYADIRNKVVIVGAGDHFEIWDQDRWNEYAKSLKVA